MEVDVHATESRTWQERVFNQAKDASWRKHYVISYPIYASLAVEGETMDLTPFIKVLAKFVAEFLSTCVEQGMDSKVDLELLDKGICYSRLEELQLGERNKLLKQLETLLADNVIVDQASWADKVTELMNDTFFRQRPGSSERIAERQAQESATVAAWEFPYQRKLHEELWKHISRLYAAERRYRNHYANMCAVVQSSGTGKSRMIDQLGTEHFIIPICLRDPNTAGFPPPDDKVRRYFLNSMELDGSTPRRFKVSYAIHRIDAFFQALFESAKAKLEEIIIKIRSENAHAPDMYRQASAEFRQFMTNGQRYNGPNADRLRFYSEIIKRAELLANPVSSRAIGSTKKGRLSPISAGEALALALELLKPSSEPAFVVAFDESAMLVDAQNDNRKPPVLSMLRNRLNYLKGVPFFSLFVSTADRIAPVSSPFELPNESRGSGRILEEHMKLNPAFTGCAFDAFDAENVTFGGGKMSVRKAASEWTMMHLGRPLWMARVNKWKIESDISDGDTQFGSISGSQSSDRDDCDARTKFLVRRDAMRFAVTKLLDTTAIDNNWQINDSQMIACLCHRLPIEFESTSPFQNKFVESHMRICLRFDPEDQTMVSVSSSEPMLSEASFVVMKNCVEKILPAMRIILGDFSVNRGDRGELVALLILLLARDEAVSRKNTEDMWRTIRLRNVASFPNEYPENLRYPVDPELIEWNRVFTVPDFLRALFGEIEGIQEDIDTLFKDTHMHFNHFIKCLQHSVLQRQYLAGLLIRGAALLCANGREAVDAVVPFSYEEEIDQSLISAIFFQVKNSPRYTDVPEWNVLDAVEVHRLGIVDVETEYPLPIVRVVFALAASRPSITGRTTIIEVEGGKRYVAVDIWCAGISNDILPCIQGTCDSSITRSSWNSLLACSQGWKAPYMLPGEDEPKDFLRVMTPCLGEDRPFWKFCPEFTDDKEDAAPRRLGGVPSWIPQSNTERGSKRKSQLDSDPASIQIQATPDERIKKGKRKRSTRS